MAVVEVHLFAAARAAVGESVVTVEPAVLSVLLDRLADRFPAFASVRPKCSYLVDGVAVHGESAKVEAGSRVDILPPFAGG